jgi:two-component system chemotaxis sensor kinase CheA
LVQIEIEDDGRGIDLEKVAARARERGLLLENSTPDPRENPYDAMTLLEILCAPGFSTRERADRASGRGVGMAIVKNTVQELGGMLNFESQAGRGTRFLIELPLTLAIADALIVAVAEETYAIPLCSVRETIAVAPESAIAFANNETIPYKGSILPLIRLANLFGLNRSETGKCDRNPTPQRQSLNGHSTKNLHVVAVGNGLTCIGIVVDRILGQREIVVRSLTDPLLQVPGITGATELGDGRAVLILDPAALGRYAMQLNAKHPL